MTFSNKRMSKQLQYEIMWWKLINDDLAVKQVICDLYYQQTKDEQGYHRSKHANSKGFSSAHAKLGSMYAERVIQGQPLTSNQIDNARKIALHYVKQIVNLNTIH